MVNKEPLEVFQENEAGDGFSFQQDHSGSAGESSLAGETETKGSRKLLE